MREDYQRTIRENQAKYAAEIRALLDKLEVANLEKKAEFERRKKAENHYDFVVAKINQANKVLDNFETESKMYPQPQDMNYRMTFDTYWNLRNALNISPLRSTNCEKEKQP